MGSQLYRVRKRGEQEKEEPLGPLREVSRLAQGQLVWPATAWLSQEV